MLCLALDASGPAASAAVVREGKLVYEALLVREKAHASQLGPMVAEALSAAGVGAADCDVIACVCGPGSFTGVRIGVALAQGIAGGLDKPCAPVNALEAWAYPYRHGSETVCVILDARAGQVYGAVFRGGERLMEDTAAPLEAFMREAAALGERFLFVGDGVGVHGQAVLEFFGSRAALEPNAVLRASSAAHLAAEQREGWIAADALRPIYLRAPQAERERAARQGHG